MTLKEQLKQELTSVAPFSLGEYLLSVDDGLRQLSCQLTALDSLACAFTRLSLRADRLSTLSSEQLKKTAEQLSARLTYLLEPISPIEVDGQGCVVQMRSNPPQKEADSTSYYELLVSRSGELSLCRYTRTVGQPRQTIPAHVTREVLARLANDFAAVVE